MGSRCTKQINTCVWLSYFLIILILYSYHVSADEKELHLYYIRHVESQWNEKKAFHRDSRISSKGIKQLEYLYDNFGNTMFKHMKNLLKLKDEEGKPKKTPKKFQIEASTLNRAQFTAFAARKSLIQTSEKRAVEHPADKENKQLLDLLKNTPYSIVQNLQEASIGIDAMSTFGEDWLKGTPAEKAAGKEKWMDYLARGFGEEFQEQYKKDPTSAAETNPFWNKLVSEDFDVLCRNAQYVSGKWSTGNFLSSLFKKNQRIERYAAYLRKLMDAYVVLVMIGGHSNWFQHFVDATVHQTSQGAKELKDKWGGDGQKVGNAHMVHVVLKPYDSEGISSVEIVSVQQLFPEPPKQWTMFSVSRNPDGDTSRAIVNY